MQLTTGPLSFYAPVPSKDAKKLFVIGAQLRAELVRNDFMSGEFVPYLGGISAGELDFSRDGKWVTYVSYPDDTLWRRIEELPWLGFPPPTHMHRVLQCLASSETKTTVFAASVSSRALPCGEMFSLRKYS